jgi:hypothetical protein
MGDQNLFSKLDQEFTATLRFVPADEGLEELEEPEDEEEGFPQDEEPNEYRYIDPAWIDAVATGLTAGAKKHPKETWKKIPAKEHAARAIRHLFLFCKGDQSDDHLINASMRCMMASVLAMAAKAAAED